MKKSLYLPGLLVACFMLLSVASRATLPTITTDPKNDTLCSGLHALFIVVANDTPDTSPITFKWQVSTDGGGTWSTISDTTFYSGTTNDTLNVTASNMLNGYWYRAIATDTTGSDTSLAALLMVDTLNAGVITGTSVVAGLGSVCVGSSTLLTNDISGGVWSHINHIADTLDPTGLVTGLAQGWDTVKYVVTNTCGAAIAQITMRVDTTVVSLPILGPTTTCVSHSILLTNANVLGTWSWNLTNGNASITSGGSLTGVSYGNDTVTYAFTNACNSVPSTIVVHIDTPLSHGVISGPSAVCVGSWITLSESVSGGMWISGNTAVAIVDGTGNVTGISQGTVIISYYLSNGCGASVAIDTITVSRAASVIVGDSVGIGATLTLTDSTIGGVWSIADTSIASIDAATGLVTGRDTGSTTVTYTVTNVCGTSFVTSTLYVGPPPFLDAIGGPATVCMGHSITLTNTTLFGKWHSKSDSLATVDSLTGVVTGHVSGTDTISYTYKNAFGTTTIIKSIFINRPPVISLTGPAIVAIGGNYFFRATPPGGTWTNSDNSVGQFVAFIDSISGGVARATFGSFVMLARGSDTIHYKVTNECGSADSMFVVSIPLISNVNGLSNSSASLQVYPNPNQGEFNVNLTSNTTEEVILTVTNIVGEKVKEVAITTNKATDIKLDQPAGVYLIAVNTSEGRITTRIVIAQ